MVNTKARAQPRKVILKEGRFVRFVRKDEWEYFERHNCTGIVIVMAMTDDKKVIFVEQYRAPVGKKVVEFPAGLMNDRNDPPGRASKESLIQAAKRELWEETGYQAQRIVKLLEGPVSSGASSDMVTMVRAFGLTKTGPGGGDATEAICVHAVPLARVPAWLRQKEKQGCLVEPKIYTGLYFLHQKGSSVHS